MPVTNSLAVSLAQQNAPETIRTQIAQMSEAQCEELLYDWEFWARPDQLPPDGDWRNWMLMAGRGAGKSRAGAEWVRDMATEMPGSHGALVAPTAADARDVMVEGDSGLLNICPPDNLPKYEPSKRRLTWPNGTRVTVYSADKPERLRGPQHHWAWCDEIAVWRYPEAWDMLMFGLRLGDDPRVVVTTTPRPTKLVQEIIADDHTVMTRATTYDNRANLAEPFFEQVIQKYEGTRLGRQELDGELLTDVPGALWTMGMVEGARIRHDEQPDMRRIVVAIDPAVTSGEDADDTGIIAAGLGVDGDGYILHDDTCHLPPSEWARRAVNRYEELQADRIVGEVNNGGDMVETTIRTVSSRASYQGVRASRGKRVRAEPVASLYEQGKIHHVGMFADLEDQMCTWVADSADGSPDRVDALVWALTELMVDNREPSLRTARKPGK